MDGSPHPEDMKATLRNALEDVGGWLDFTEAWVLHETARHACESIQSPLLVEIGSYHGRSAIAFALGLKAGGRGRLFAIDPWQFEPGQFELFEHNIERAGIRDLVEPVREFSHDARGRFSTDSVDILFIDGDHTYDAVVQDITEWKTTLTDGAVIAFNDAVWLNDVRRAVIDTVAHSHSGFRNPRWIFNTLLFDYKPAAPWSAPDTIRLVRLRSFLALGWRWTKLHGRLERSTRFKTGAKQLHFKFMLATLSLVLPKAHGSR